MTLQELMESIDLSESVRRQVKNFTDTCDKKTVEKVVKQYTTGDAEEAYRQSAELFGDGDGGMAILACQLSAAAQLYDCFEQYRDFGDVFTATMKCFSRFLKENRERLGREIFDKGWWSWRQVGKRLFRLGALEFEYRADGEIGIHIPSDAVFSPSEVDKALALSHAFTARFFPAYGDADYTCDSWLLSPALKDLLPPTSNIVNFQNRFDIVKFVPEHQGYKLNLFCCPKDTDPSAFEENTGLQLAAKAFVLAGGKIGCAKGIMKK